MSEFWYDPKVLGLELVMSTDLAGNYEFDQLDIYRDTNGKLFYGIDSGCSCPMPFDWVTSVNDLRELSAQNWSQFVNDVDTEWGQYMNDAWTKTRKIDAIRKAKMLLETAHS